MPRFIYISKVDEDHSDYNATFNALRERYGNKIAPVIVPIWDASHKVTGIIDVLNKRAYEMQNLKRVEIEVPEDKASVVEEFNDALKEAVAETDEALMEKFFMEEPFTEEELRPYFPKKDTTIADAKRVVFEALDLRQRALNRQKAKAEQEKAAKKAAPGKER